MIKLKFATPVAAVAAAALMTLASSSAMAVVVCNTAPFGTSLPFTVPATIDGVYANFVTGAFATATPFPAGWDFNPYVTGGNFNFFWSTGAANTTVGMLDGASTYGPFPANVVVGPTSTFGIGGAATAAQMLGWRAGTTATNSYLGVRFNDESVPGTRYGWVKMTTTAGTGLPATVDQFCYQNDGTQILTGGTVPVSLQKFSVD